MPASDVSICNLALQKLGAVRITALSDDSRNARSMNACYELIRDQVQRAYFWSFAKKRATLAPSSTAPEWGFTYAFPLPSDFLRLMLPPRTQLDWVLETVADQLCILTNDADTLLIRYVSRVTDPTRFDPLFVDALSCKLAWHTCEEITQSNEKKAAINTEFKEAIAMARRTNAFESTPGEPAEDTWNAARRVGSTDNTRRQTFDG